MHFTLILYSILEDLLLYIPYPSPKATGLGLRMYLERSSYSAFPIKRLGTALTKVANSNAIYTKCLKTREDCCMHLT